MTLKWWKNKMDNCEDTGSTVVIDTVGPYYGDDDSRAE